MGEKSIGEQDHLAKHFHAAATKVSETNNEECSNISEGGRDQIISKSANNRNNYKVDKHNSSHHELKRSYTTQYGNDLDDEEEESENERMPQKYNTLVNTPNNSTAS